MPLTRSQKEELLKKFVEQIKSSKSVVFANFQGLSVKDMRDLRKRLREKGANFQVIKKTLIKLAVKEAKLGEISDELLEGPIGVAFSLEDEIAAAKILNTFAKGNEHLKLRGALFDGKILSLAETKQLALIPSKEELIVKFLYLLKSPIQRFHSVLYNTISGFVRVLNSIKEKHEQAAGFEKAGEIPAKNGLAV